MFDGLDPSMKTLFGVSVDHTQRLLSDDRAVVHFLVDEVDAYPCHLYPVGEGFGHGVSTREGGKEGGVDVEDTKGERPHGGGGQDSHEASQDQSFNPRRCLDDRFCEGISTGIIRVWHHGAFDTSGGGSLQSSGVVTVGDDPDDVQLFDVSVDQGLEIRTGTGYENCDVDGFLRYRRVRILSPTDQISRSVCRAR